MSVTAIPSYPNDGKVPLGINCQVKDELDVGGAVVIGGERSAFTLAAQAPGVNALFSDTNGRLNVKANSNTANIVAFSTDTASSGNNPTFGTATAATLTANTSLFRKSPSVLVAGNTASTILTNVNSGSNIFLAQATTNNAVTLPAPTTAGLYFRFVAQSTANGANTWTISSTGANIKGRLIGTAAGLVPTVVAGNTNLIFSATAANTKAGDDAIFESDGTSWWLVATSSGTANGWSVT